MVSVQILSWTTVLSTNFHLNLNLNACCRVYQINLRHKNVSTYQLSVFLGKIINFSGWLLPVQYQEAIAASHQHTRTFASLFDVGHMLQTQVSGKHATEFLESLTTSDLKNLNRDSAVLTVFTNENGGILDDLIITKDDDDKYFVVSNAGRRDEDSELLLQQQVDTGIHFVRK